MRILVVDDDETLRFTVRSTLETRAYKVDEAEDGEQAIILSKTSRWGNAGQRQVSRGICLPLFEFTIYLMSSVIKSSKNRAGLGFVSCIQQGYVSYDISSFIILLLSF